MYRKLLVYSDGGLQEHRLKDRSGLLNTMYGSYAIYSVSPGTTWGMIKNSCGWYESENDVATRHFELARAADPMVHVKRATMLLGDTEMPTNNLAEAKTLKKAAQCVLSMVSKDPDIREVEFCLDSKIVLNTVTGAFGKARSDPWFKRVANDARSIVGQLAGIRVKWSWISGDVMKRTVIGH